MLTNPDQIWTPDHGDDYSLTTDLAAMAASIQTVFNRRGNAYKGTTAERLSTTVPVGSSWTDTDGNFGTWVRRPGGWAPAPGSTLNVADRTEADAMLSQLQQSGVNLSTFPLYVLRRDNGNLEVHTGGTGWVTIGGPPEAGVSKKGVIYPGWSGHVHFAQSNGMCMASFGVMRTDPTFTRAAWETAAFASGLPGLVQQKPGSAIRLQLGTALSNAAESTDHYAISLTSTGVLGIDARWQTRSFPQNCWWSGSFVYPTAA